MSSDSAIQQFQRPVVGRFDPAWSGKSGDAVRPRASQLGRQQSVVAHNTSAGSQATAAAPASGTTQASIENLPNAAWRQSGTELERIEFLAPAAPDGGQFSFDDLLDLVNPLQHIPVVSAFYRDITGDQISAPAKIFGGALFGGPLGFVSSIVETVVSEIAGNDIGETLIEVAGLSSRPETGESGMADARQQAALAQKTGGPVAGAAAAEMPITESSAPTKENADTAAFGTRRVPQAPNHAQFASAMAAYGAAGTDSLSEAVEPATLNTQLTGKAALGAFLADLRDVGSQASLTAAAGTSPSAPAEPLAKAASADAAKAIPLREQDWQGRINSNPPISHAVSIPSAVGSTAGGAVLPQAALGEGEFTQQMLNALDKYQSLAKARFDADQGDAVGDRDLREEATN